MADTNKNIAYFIRPCAVFFSYQDLRTTIYIAYIHTAAYATGVSLLSH